VHIDVLTSPLGTPGPTEGMSVGETVSRYSTWCKLTVAETPGWAYNMQFMGKYPDRWSNTLVQSDDYTQMMAAKPLAPYFTEPVSGMRKVITHSMNSYLFATLDPNIKTAADLAGKSVGLGLAGQVAYAVAPKQLLEIGEGLEGNLDIQYVGPANMVSSLTDGLVDAVWVVNLNSVGPVDDPVWALAGFTNQLLATGKTVYYFGYSSQDVFDKVAASIGIQPPSIVVKAGTVPGQTEDCLSFMHPAGLWAHVTFPEEYAYEVVKQCIEHPEDVDSYVPASGWTADTGAMFMTQANSHPGALQAFADAGITISE